MTANSTGLRCASAGSSVSTAARVPVAHQRAGLVRVLAEHAARRREHHVVGERLAQPGAVGRAGGPANSRWSCGKPARRAEGLLPDRGVEALGQRDQGRPACARRRRRRRPPARASSRASSSAASSSIASSSAARERTTRAAAAAARSGGLLGPVVLRDDDDRRAARGGRGVVGAHDGAGHVLGAQRLLEGHRVVAREPVEPAGEERLEREVAAVLLADEHHQRRAVDARGGERADRVAEARPSCAAAPAPAPRARARSPSPSPPRSPRAARARTSCRRAARRGTAPRSSPGWRRSS